MDFILIIGLVIFLTFAFVGLLGAIYRNLELPTSTPSGWPFKKYGKKSSVRWGLLSLFAYSALPVIAFFAYSRDKLDRKQVFLLFGLVLVTSFLLAVVIRRTRYFSRLSSHKN